MNSRAQQIIEYLILAAGLIVTFLAVAGPNGPLRRVIESALDQTINIIGEDLPTYNVYSWEYAQCGDCSQTCDPTNSGTPGIQTCGSIQCVDPDGRVVAADRCGSQPAGPWVVPCGKVDCCGNGVIDGEEACDPGIEGATFACTGNPNQSMACGGTVGCGVACQISYWECALCCGNGVLDSGEACDPGMDPPSCDGNPDAGNQCGTAACTPCGYDGCDGACQISYAGCESCGACGNGQLDEGEQCDGDLFAADCTNLSYIDSRTGRPTLYEGGVAVCRQCSLDLNYCCKNITSQPSSGQCVLSQGAADAWNLETGGGCRPGMAFFRQLLCRNDRRDPVIRYWCEDNATCLERWCLSRPTPPECQ